MAQAEGREDASATEKDLTVLYLDVVGFTSYSESHVPQAAVSMLNEVFGICEVISTQCHGDIDKFIGDCVMAVFIDANDAVEAASRIQAALAQLNAAREEKGETPVAIRIGMNSGLVVQGDIGTPERKDLTVIGDVVNTAARIQTLAQPNTTYASEATVSRLANPDAFQFVCEAEVKGKKRGVPVFQYTP
jgi:adenylate cyclase